MISLHNLYSKLLQVIVIILMLPGLYSCHDTTMDDYEQEWIKANEDEANEIKRVLMANNITGCADLFMRKDKEQENEFLLACSSNGINWNYYIVYIEEKKVKFYNDAAVKPPQIK